MAAWESVREHEQHIWTGHSRGLADTNWPDRDRSEWVEYVQATYGISLPPVCRNAHGARHWRQ